MTVVLISFNQPVESMYRAEPAQGCQK